MTNTSLEAIASSSGNNAYDETTSVIVSHYPIADKECIVLMQTMQPTHFKKRTQGALLCRQSKSIGHVIGLQRSNVSNLYKSINCNAWKHRTLLIIVRLAIASLFWRQIVIKWYLGYITVLVLKLQFLNHCMSRINRLKQQKLKLPISPTLDSYNGRNLLLQT